MIDTAPFGVIDYMGYGAVIVFKDGIPHIVAECPPAEARRIACALNRAR